ncbi:hypothetical protein CTA1_3394 [Colletotrichum tanaceti]|uniref:Uncharacterized protein n=1 Tax=Colletotrichum tanaceti TaxID=1306861 RepID=A0A4U6X0Y9_9PEZI|nr:hypothetical protein CTA1_3394 [Colletotrichum tanaceti]
MSSKAHTASGSPAGRSPTVIPTPDLAHLVGHLGNGNNDNNDNCNGNDKEDCFVDCSPEAIAVDDALYAALLHLCWGPAAAGAYLLDLICRYLGAGWDAWPAWPRRGRRTPSGKRGDEWYRIPTRSRRNGGHAPAHLDEGALVAHPGLEPLAAVLDADAARLPAADGHLGGRLAPGVDPGDAGLEARDDAVAGVDVAAKDAGGEPDVGGVGAGDGLVDGVVDEDAHDGAKDLVPHDGHVVGAVGEDGRLDPVARLVGRRQALGLRGAADQQRGLVLHDAAADVGLHLFEVGLVVEGAEVGGRVEQVAGADVADPLEHELLEAPLEGAGHEDAGAVGADLAGAVKVGEHGAVDGLADVAVRQDDDGALAAELHGDVLHAGGGGGGDLFAGAHLAGEADLCDVRVGGQVGADVAGAVDDVEDAVGHAGLPVDVGEVLGVQRGELARLVDHAVAGGQAGARLPQGDLDGVVPGADAGADAEGLLGGVDPGGGAQAEGLAVEAARGDEVGKVLEHVGARDDVDVPGLGEGLAGVEGLDAGEGVVALAEDGDGAQQHAGALGGRRGGPRRKGRLGGVDGGVDGRRRRRVDGADGLCRGRIDGLERARGVRVRLRLPRVKGVPVLLGLVLWWCHFDDDDDDDVRVF